MFKIKSLLTLIAILIASTVCAGGVIVEHEANVQKKLRETSIIDEICHQKLEYYADKVAELEEMIAAGGPEAETAEMKLDYFKANLADYQRYCVESE